MTLSLKLHRIDFHKLNTQDLYVLVEGSQAGTLKSEEGKRGSWNIPFQISCASTDKLNIKVYDNIKTVQQHFYGRASISAQKLIKDYKQEFQNSREIQCEISLQRRDEQIAIMVFSAQFNQKLKYEGQYPSNRGLNIIGADGKKKYVDFYKATCPTYNLFSWMDQRSDDKQTYRSIQSFYRNP